jgi:hypothetical protein
MFVRSAKVIADTRLAPEEKRAETFVFDAEPRAPWCGNAFNPEMAPIALGAS